MTFLLFDSRKFLDLFESMTSSAHSLWSVSLQSTWVTSTSSYVYWSLQQFLLLVCSHQFELPNNLLNSLSLSESSVLVLKLTFGKLQFWKQFLRLFHLLISMCFLTNLMLLKYWSLQQFLVLICFHQFENKLYKYYYIVLITPASWE